MCDPYKQLTAIMARRRGKNLKNRVDVDVHSFLLKVYALYSVIIMAASKQ